MAGTDAAGQSEFGDDGDALEMLVGVYTPLLVQHVEDPSVLSTYMTHIIKVENRKKISRMEVHEPCQAMKLLLEILSSSREPGRYQCFLDALIQADYPYLSKVLNGGNIKYDMVHQVKLIELFTPTIMKRISAVDLIPDLVSVGVINSRDGQGVRAVGENYGMVASAICLLGKIPNRVEDWFGKFISVLINSGHKILAETIDPDMYLKKMNQKADEDNLKTERQMDMEEERQMDTKGEQYSIITEPLVTVTGGSGKSIGDECGQELVSGVSGFDSDDPDLADVEDNMAKLSMDCTDDNITRLKKSAQRAASVSSSAPDFMPNIRHSDDHKAPLNNMDDSNRLDGVASKQLINKTIEVPSTERDQSSDSKTVVEELELRSYQMELAAHGLNGKNTLICAPTGSGKTHVAVKIIQDHLQNPPIRRISKVIFLVNQVALADQQAKLCKRYLDYRIQAISGDSQRNEKVSFNDLLQMNDILVVTAQILLDAMVNGEIDSIQCFTLMVFDECHHTHTKHPFNQIMFHYMDLKDSSDAVTLPQIIGLTASVGVGKAKTMSKAKDHIRSLMANLDATELSTVRENLEELGNHVSYPHEEVVSAPSRTNDLFHILVLQLMDCIEKMMSKTEHVQHFEGRSGVTKAPSNKGSEQYTQWISVLWKESAKIRDQETRRFFMSCRNHLDWYNNALIIYSDARVKDALEYLEEKMKYWIETAVFNETDKTLKIFYEKSVEQMKTCIESDNPKLKYLQRMLIDAFKNNEDSRGIIFVKTRNLVKALESWMNEVPGLRELNPKKFVGAQVSADKGGMTKHEQVDILSYFKQGKHKVIIATSVAEEGLDISKCNLVIRYDHVTNEIAMVQSRGRGRAEDSSFIVLTEQNKGTAEKQQRNMIREVLMNKAILELQDDIETKPQEFCRDIKKLQEDAKMLRALESMRREGKYKRAGEFELRCVKCDEFACMSSDVRRIQSAHHVVLDEDFENRIKVVIYPRPQYFDTQYEVKGKIHCKNCGSAYGTLAVHRKIDFYVIKVANFIISDSNDRKMTCKKWKQSPFSVTDLTNDDFKRMIDTQQEFLNDFNSMS
ncbi:hypothetical protein ScPMuIL_000964 [Solemya velum]